MDQSLDLIWRIHLLFSLEDQLTGRMSSVTHYLSVLPIASRFVELKFDTLNSLNGSVSGVRFLLLNKVKFARYSLLCLS